MPLYGPLSSDLIEDIRSRFSRGEAPKAIAIDLDMSATTVGAYVADLPQTSPKKEARRIAILVCLDEGLDAQATALRVPCKIAQVVRIIRAMRASLPIVAATMHKPAPTVEPAPVAAARYPRARGTGRPVGRPGKPFEDPELERKRLERNEAARRNREARKAKALQTAPAELPCALKTWDTFARDWVDVARFTTRAEAEKEAFIRGPGQWLIDGPP